MTISKLCDWLCCRRAHTSDNSTRSVQTAEVTDAGRVAAQSRAAPAAKPGRLRQIFVRVKKSPGSIHLEEEESHNPIGRNRASMDMLIRRPATTPTTTPASTEPSMVNSFPSSLIYDAAITTDLATLPPQYRTLNQALQDGTAREELRLFLSNYEGVNNFNLLVEYELYLTEKDTALKDERLGELFRRFIDPAALEQVNLTDKECKSLMSAWSTLKNAKEQERAKAASELEGMLRRTRNAQASQLGMDAFKRFQKTPLIRGKCILSPGEVKTDSGLAPAEEPQVLDNDLSAVTFHEG
jgi:hypothetical protein